MRSLVIFLGLLCVATPAFAISDMIIDYCLTRPDPKACLQDVINAQEQHQRDLQRDAYLQAMELARLQANGLALFGSGAALINGMNQSLQRTQIPLVNTSDFTYTSPPR